MTAVEDFVHALASCPDMPPFVAIPGFPRELLDIVKETWADVRVLLSKYTDGDSILIARSPAWDRVVMLRHADLLAEAEKNLSFATDTLRRLRAPAVPGELRFLITDGKKVSVPRLTFNLAAMAGQVRP